MSYGYHGYYGHNMYDMYNRNFWGNRRFYREAEPEADAQYYNNYYGYSPMRYNMYNRNYNGYNMYNRNFWNYNRFYQYYRHFFIWNTDGPNAILYETSAT